MKYTKIIKRETKILMLIVIMLLVIVLGVSYAMFMKVTDNTNNQIVTTGTLQIEYASTNGYLNGETYPEILPMSNNEGLSQSGYEFSVKNTGTIPVGYQVYLYINEEEFNADKTAGKVTGSLFKEIENIKYNLQTNSDGNEKINKLSEIATKEENSITKYIIYSGTVKENNTTNVHKLRIWLDEEIEIENIGKYVYLKLEVIGNVKGQNPDINTYAVKRNIETSSTAWERIEDSTGLIANATKDGSAVQNDFDNIYPWSDIKTCNYDTSSKQKGACYGEEEFTFTPEGNVEVMTYIPEFYYKREQKDGYEYVYITKNEQEGYTKSEAFSVGRYTMSGDASRVHSRSGVTPLVSTTITNFRTYATTLGMQQMDYHYFILQLLYLVEYADYNSQNILGLGYTDSSNTAAITSGGCNELGMKSGTINNDGKHSMIYRGIEDIYGNIWQFVDGINIKDNQTYINYNPSTYAVDIFSGDYQQLGYVNVTSTGYPTKLGYDANNSLISFPTAVGGSDSTYISDNYYQVTGNRIALVGGACDNSLRAGLWYWNVYSASSNSATYLGARLLMTS